MQCKSCGSKSITRDGSEVICSNCGTVLGYDGYEHSIYNRASTQPQGTFVRIGTTGTGSVLPYKEKKIFEANKLIDSYMFKLNLSGQSADRVRGMVREVTEEEFGAGEWFGVLIGACAYVVMRSGANALSIAEVSVAVGCDEWELGRMVRRVVEHLGLELPEFDLVCKFERVVRNLVVLGTLEEGQKVERMRQQGVFLLQCMIKWFLTTGRRPLPVVAAVLVFVGEVNGVEGLKIDEVASHLNTMVATSRLRYKELLNMLVKVAQKALPWGDDVTVKNVVKYAQFLLRYLEVKSMGQIKSGDGDGEGSNTNCLDLEDMIGECFADEVNDDFVANGSGSEFRSICGAATKNSSACIESVPLNVDKLRLSHECVAMIYDKFISAGGFAEHDAEVMPNERKRRREFDLDVADWWSGKSELSKKMTLKQILEKDVGLDGMPPSFINGIKENERRRSKINAAKMRINKIMHPLIADSADCCEIYRLEGSHDQKKRRKGTDKSRKAVDQCLDSEDFVIETLLLHQVKEDEIEKGHYNALLALHVFNSETMSEDPESY